jgi:murein DD-endopeptidase MepM/ murein hydrolase activator NlpD
MRFSNSSQKIIVVPARAAWYKIGELDVVNLREPYRFGYQFKYNYGDATINTADTSVLYDLPFAKEKTFYVNQGYNGKFSHQGENALDLTMPEGTEIMAAREGIVVKVVQENNQSCALEVCKKYNNSVLIYHSDGSFAEYAHISFNGSLVKVGDKVKKNDIIAHSGNTGWSAGPHLHFVAFLPGMEKRRSIATKFRTGDGQSSSFLEEKQAYSKYY